MDATGNVYLTGVASNNAFKITPGGAITEIIDATGDGAGRILVRPGGIAVDVAGNVYVAGVDSNNAFKITPTGVITEIVDATGAGLRKLLDSPADIAADGAGNVYVTGFFSDNAFRITPCGDGVVDTAFGEICDDGNGSTGDGCSPSSAPSPDVVATNRYLSFSNIVPGRSQAVRITVVDLPPPNSSLAGSTAWVAAPQLVSQSGGSIVPIPGIPNFNAATLTGAPVFMDWSTLGTVHVWHKSIIPSGTYALQIIDQACDVSIEIGFSPALNLTQGVWGDVVGAFDSTNNVWMAPDGVVDVTSDVISIVDKFTGKTTAPSKVWVDIEPVIPDRLIDISDAVRAIDAFRGQPYPFPAGP